MPSSIEIALGFVQLRPAPGPALKQFAAPRQTSRRFAFSVMELLVVISIIGMLVGLLLPAIQAARESGRKAQCANNLRQLGQAIQEFQTKAGYLPANTRPSAVNDQARISWETYILPHLEQSWIYSKIDLTQSWSSSTVGTGQVLPNSAIVGTRLSIFTCPSSIDPARQDGDPQQTPWAPIAAITDYSTITRVEQPLVDAGLADVAGPGIMPPNAQSSFDYVRDGLSNTILLAESAGRPAVYRKRVPISAPPEVRVNGGGWCRPGSDYGLDGSSADGTAFPGPCAINCTNGENIAGQSFPYPAPYGYQGTGETYAFHPQGANILFADGSVRFAFEKVDIRVMARLVTRDMLEVVTLNDLEP